jgi:hypothetical protein
LLEKQRFGISLDKRVALRRSLWEAPKAAALRLCAVQPTPHEGPDTRRRSP